MYNINAHNLSGVRNYVNNPDWRIVDMNDFQLFEENYKETYGLSIKGNMK